MIIRINRLTVQFHILFTVASLVLISTHAYGQKSKVYKPVNIDSILHTPIILPDYNAHRISNCQFIVHYTGEIRVMGQSKVSCFEQLNDLHPEIKLHFIKTDAVIKTKGNRELLLGLRDVLVLEKLKPWNQPKELKIKVKMIEQNFKAGTVVGLYCHNLIYRNLIIQDFEVIKKINEMSLDLYNFSDSRRCGINETNTWTDAKICLNVFNVQI